jgi:hypothetical protein
LPCYGSGVEVRHSSFGFDPTEDSTERLADFSSAAEELPGVLTDSQNESLRLGGISITPNGSNSMTIDFVIKETEDLVNWNTVETVSYPIEMSGVKKFIRVELPETAE